MALKYYMDVHIPAAITEGLRRRRINVLTSQEDGTREADDEVLLQRATDLDRIHFFSQDDDLLGVANRWQRDGHPFTALIFARQGIGIGRSIEELEIIAQCCSAEELANRVIYLPLR